MNYCNDCATKKGLPVTKERIIRLCDFCGELYSCNVSAPALPENSKKMTEEELIKMMALSEALNQFVKKSKK